MWRILTVWLWFSECKDKPRDTASQIQFNHKVEFLESCMFFDLMEYSKVTAVAGNLLRQCYKFYKLSCHTGNQKFLFLSENVQNLNNWCPSCRKYLCILDVSKFGLCILDVSR